MSKNKLTIIIPVHELANKKDEDFLDRAILSLEKQSCKDFDIIFYAKQGLDYDFPNIGELIIGIEDFSYAKAVNTLKENYVKTPWFSVLEFDDVFHEHYVKNTLRYIETMGDEYDVFFSLMADVNAENTFMGLRNEAAWSVGNMDVLGILDLENVKKNFSRYSTAGAIFKTSEFLGFKENFPIYFTFEYMLRALNKSQEIYVIPKIMLNHTFQREGSYYDLCNKMYSDYERKAYLNYVAKEYMFDADREINIVNKQD